MDYQLMISWIVRFHRCLLPKARLTWFQSITRKLRMSYETQYSLIEIIWFSYNFFLLWNSLIIQRPIFSRISNSTLWKNPRHGKTQKIDGRWKSNTATMAPFAKGHILGNQVGYDQFAENVKRVDWGGFFPFFFGFSDRPVVWYSECVRTRTWAFPLNKLRETLSTGYGPGVEKWNLKNSSLAKGHARSSHSAVFQTLFMRCSSGM